MFISVGLARSFFRDDKSDDVILERITVNPNLSGP